MLLTAFLSMAGLLSSFSSIIQVLLSRDGIAHTGLGLSKSVSNQKTAPQSCSQANLMEVAPQLSFRFPR